MPTLKITIYSKKIWLHKSREISLKIPIYCTAIYWLENNWISMGRLGNLPSLFFYIIISSSGAYKALIIKLATKFLSIE